MVYGLELILASKIKFNLFFRQVWKDYESALLAQYAPPTGVVSNDQKTYENYRSQHQTFVNHANHQLQQLEQQKNQIEQQIAAASVQVSLHLVFHIIHCTASFLLA